MCRFERSCALNPCSNSVNCPLSSGRIQYAVVRTQCARICRQFGFCLSACLGSVFCKEVFNKKVFVGFCDNFKNKLFAYIFITSERFIALASIKQFYGPLQGCLQSGVITCELLSLSLLHSDNNSRAGSKYTCRRTHQLKKFRSKAVPWYSH